MGFGKKLRLKGLGFPNGKSERGDLYVQLNPESLDSSKLTPEIKESLERLKNSGL
jgi:DnaJ-class molecular chaperone